jgi:hypothetical protein
MPEPNIVSGLIEEVDSEHIRSGVLTGISDTYSVLMSFDTNLQTTTRLYFPFKVTVNKLRGIVMKAIAAVDNGTITAANATGDMANGVITATASDALNVEYSVSPTTNNIIQKDGYLQLVSAKTTVGGEVLVSIEVTRTK